MPVTDTGLMYLKNTNTNIKTWSKLCKVVNTLNIFFLYFLISCAWVFCLHVSGHYMHAVPTKARRGGQISGTGVTQVVVSYHVGAGNGYKVPWKSSQCS